MEPLTPIDADDLTWAWSDEPQDRLPPPPRSIEPVFPDTWKGEIRVIYRRHPDREDFTSPLPSSRHMYYVAKGWTAVAIEDPPEGPGDAEIAVPEDIAEYGRQDRVGIWRRGTDEIESSCRNAKSLLARNWTFAGLADEDRRRAVAEARPITTKKK